MTGIEVIVVGAGPAGSVAALVLARAGVRVWLIDRSPWPRPKLCGDTINPGAVASLCGLGLVGGPLNTAERLTGMLVTSPRVSVRGSYPDGRVALVVSRDRFDAWLVDAAVAAGAEFSSGVRVRGPLWRDLDGPELGVGGVEIAREGGGTCPVAATMTIGADGRRSVLARMAQLSEHPRAPRRWAFGMYATDVAGMSDVGEMHVRNGRYIGLAPLGGGVSNICVVTGRRPEGRSVSDIIRRALSADLDLQARTRQLRVVGIPQALGPLAVDCGTPGVRGLLLAGDAAGFVDPMTGDGVHLAIRGGMLAAAATLDALRSGVSETAASVLARRRAEAFGQKLRFNRCLRSLVGSPMAMEATGLGAKLVPSMVRHLVRYAGDAA